MKERLKKFTKISNFKILALCVLVIIVIIYYYEDFRETEIKIPTTEVVVLKNDVPENTVIEKEMLVLEQKYEEEVLKSNNIAISFDDVIGKITLVPLYKGELIKNDRLFEKEKGMNTSNLKTDIALQLNDIDRALNLQKGDYIDIWLEPIDISLGIMPQKLFSKLKVKEIVNSSMETIDKDKEYSDGEKKVASYIVLSLTDGEIDNLYNVDKAVNNIRITRYLEKDFYNITSQVITNSLTHDNEGDLVE